MFPKNFSSQKEFDSYCNCLSHLKIGDKVQITSPYGDLNGFFLYKEFRNTKFLSWEILIGSESRDDNRLFHLTTLQEKRRYLIPAKKACPKILIGSTKLFWLPTDGKILKIVKYNAVQEEKEKKDKAAKSLRARRHDAQGRPTET